MKIRMITSQATGKIALDYILQAWEDLPTDKQAPIVRRLIDKPSYPTTSFEKQVILKPVVDGASFLIRENETGDDFCNLRYSLSCKDSEEVLTIVKRAWKSKEAK